MFIPRLGSNNEICEEAKETLKVEEKHAKNVRICTKVSPRCGVNKILSLSLVNSGQNDLTSSELSCGDLHRSRAERRLRVLVLSCGSTSF